MALALIPEAIGFSIIAGVDPKDLRKHPRRSSLVMLATVVTVVGTSKSGPGRRRAVVGNLLCLEGLANLSVFRRSSRPMGGNETTCFEEVACRGENSWPSTITDFQERLECVRLDVSKGAYLGPHRRNAVDTAVLKFRRQGPTVEQLNDASVTIMDNLAVHDEPGAMGKMLGH